MNVFTTIDKDDIQKRIIDKKRLAKRDGHEDGYWFSLLDSLYEDLVHSLKYHPMVDIGDLATKDYVDTEIKKIRNSKFG